MSVKMLYLKRNDFDDNKYGKVVIAPLEKGFGRVVGNALRRILLSSLPGAGITSVKVDGTLHEFSIIEGMFESVSDLVHNLKKIVFKLDSKEPATVILDVKGSGEFTAKDLTIPADIEIINPDQYICTLNKKAKLYCEITVENGRGYVSEEKNKQEDSIIGTIFTDTNYSPVKKVSYFVDPCKDHEELNLDVWTDGSIKMDHALTIAAKLFKSHITHFGEEIQPFDSEDPDVIEEEEEVIDKHNIPITDLELSVRSRNCLKLIPSKTLGELCEYSSSEIMELKNFGKKSLDEIREKLVHYGLCLKGDEHLLKEEK